MSCVYTHLLINRSLSLASTIAIGEPTLPREGGSLKASGDLVGSKLVRLGLTFRGVRSWSDQLVKSKRLILKAFNLNSHKYVQC